MPKCQPAEIHSRDANLQYSVKMHIYRNIRLCPNQGSILSTNIFMHMYDLKHNYASKSTPVTMMVAL